MKAIKFIFATAVIALASCAGTAKTEAAGTEAEEQTTEVEAAELTPAQTPGEEAEAVVALEKGATELPTVNVPVIVDFSATWCGPCQRFKPIFHKVAQEYKGKALFVSVDTDDCPEISQKFGVQSIPYIVAVLPDGTALEGLIGLQTEDDFKVYVEKAINNK